MIRIEIRSLPLCCIETVSASFTTLLKCKSVSDERTFVPQNFDNDACIRENFFVDALW